MENNQRSARPSALLESGAEFFRKYDGAFLLSRVALVVPVLVASRAMPESAAFSTFSEKYHVGLFLAGIALYGGHEAYLVDRDDITSGFYHLLLNGVALAGIGLILDAGNVLRFSITLLVFAVAFRGLFLYFITLYRFRRRGYLLLSVALALSCGLMALQQGIGILHLTPLLAVYAVLAHRARILRLDRLRRAIRTYLTTLREHFYYVGNYVLSSMYVQGALFLYAFTATDTEYAVATHFVYILGGAYILLDLLYRYSIVRFSDPDTSSVSVLVETLVTTGAVAVVIAVPLFFLVPLVESILFAKTLLDSSLALFMGTTIVVHSTNFAWSSFFIGTSRVHLQFRLTALTGIALVCSLMSLEWAGTTNAFAPAFLVTTVFSSLVRGGTAVYVLKAN